MNVVTLVPQITIESSSKKTLDNARKRLVVVLIGFLCFYGIISLRLIELALFDKRAFKDIPTESFTEVKVVRGNIIDRNGILLASNLVTASLYANPKRMFDKKEAAEQLHKVFPDLSKQSIIEKLDSDKSFVWIRRSITPKEQKMVNDLGIPGFEFQSEEKRIYPQGNMLAHVLGYVGRDGLGLSGIEQKYNEYLSSAKAKNNPLQLSIDVRVQDIMHNELQKTVDVYKAKGATGVVMDAHNGEIIALVNLPDFNPHHPEAANDEAKFNRATLGVYEMGSTFKAFTTAMALDSGIVNIGDVYDARQPLKYANFTIKDLHPKSRMLTVPEIFMYSSNIGVAQMALEVGTKRQKEFLSRLGLLQSVQLDIPEKSSPIYPKQWKKINTITISYGHGIAVTPMHVVNATAALINGGILRNASFIKHEEDHVPEGKRVIKESTSELMRRLFRLVVKHGTGTRADAEGYFVGGKTGTADKVSSSGGYKTNSRLSSFVGAFPMNDPKYVILVIIDEPQGLVATGGATAAPAVGQIVTNIAPILGVKPIEDRGSAQDNLHIDYQYQERKIAFN